MVKPLLCPVCSAIAAGSRGASGSRNADSSDEARLHPETTIRRLSCPTCDTDLSELLAIRRASRRLARDAWRDGREGRVGRAAVRVREAVRLYRDEELGPLFGWLLFLDGDTEGAAACWDRIPPRARQIADVYNRALEAARSGRWRTAATTAGEIDLPFHPALLLRLGCARRTGDAAEERKALEELSLAFREAVRERAGRGVSGARAEGLPSEEEPDEAPSERGGGEGARREDSEPPGPTRTVRSAVVPRRHAPMAALGLLLVGTGLGWAIAERIPGRERTGSPRPGAISSGPASPASGGSPEAAPANRSGGPSAARSDAKPPAELDGPDAAPNALQKLHVVQTYLERDAASIAAHVADPENAAPARELRDIPVPVREETARQWYLDGLARFRRGETRRAVELLTAAVASVGSGASLYWVDDALYTLVRIFSEPDREPDRARAGTWARTLLEHHAGSSYANSVTRSAAAVDDGGRQ